MSARDASISTSDGAFGGYLAVPGTANGAGIVVIQEIFGVNEFVRAVADSYAARGYFCATIEYRFSQEAIFPAQIEDCKCAIRFLRSRAKEYNLNPDRIGVAGASAGGHLAALLGTAGHVKELEGKGGSSEFSSKVQAVCDYCGPSDLIKIVGDSVGANNPVVKLLGGEPASEEISMWWNFVARDRTELEQAYRDWESHAERFGPVDSTLDRIGAPLPFWLH